MTNPLEQGPTSTPLWSFERAVETYRQVIIQFLQEQSQKALQHDHVEQQAVIDREHDHYLLVWVGWNQDETRREYLVLLHFDLIDGKIWLQQNSTELLVEQLLVERGVSSQDIVLGLLPSFTRQHSGYGVG